MKQILIAVMTAMMALASCTYGYAGTDEQVTHDRFWGYSVVVVNRMDHDITALSYSRDYSGHYLRYACYAGDIRRVHHVHTRLVIGNCTINAAELKKTCTNVVVIEEDGNIHLGYTTGVRR